MNRNVGSVTASIGPSVSAVGGSDVPFPDGDRPMSERRFERWQESLSSESLQLFDRLVDLHQDAERGADRQFVWTKSKALGKSSSNLTWSGDPTTRGDRVSHDTTDLTDLTEARLLVRGDRKNSWRLPREAILFHRWRIEQAGPTPIAQVESQIRSMIDDPARLKRLHATTAQHLTQAFDLLWSGETDDKTIIDLGGSLRSALAAVTADIVGYTVDPEAVAKALKPWFEVQGRLPPRSAEALQPFVEWTMRCCQRLHHLLSNRSKGDPDPAWSEMRRTAFLAAVLIEQITSIE